MKTCPSCGHASEDAKRFCRHCGAALPGAANVRDSASLTEIRQAAERACPWCGMTLPRAHAKFCRFCGSPLAIVIILRALREAGGMCGGDERRAPMCYKT